MERVTKEEYGKRLVEGIMSQTFKMDPKVPISLRGEEYTLEYDNQAAMDVVSDCGFNILTDELFPVQYDPKVVGSLLFRGLQGSHPSMTFLESNRLFTTRHFPYIIRKIAEALRGFLPDMSDVEVLKEKSTDTKVP